jgi:3'-phosphoadenosine 5'-phosphosulfate sulfotransferase (PAPS reductase)/FAD synthetase
MGGEPVIDPFLIDGPTCISFSGGRTSAYMLWRAMRANGAFGPDVRVIFCNTGKEEEATLRFVDRCSREWGVSITWLEYQGEAGVKVVDFASASRNGEPFEAVIAQRGGVLPNRVARFCSSEMKTRTMHRHLRAQGWTEWDTFIGIRADEPRRVAKFRATPHPEGKHEEVHMPLALAGIGAAAVGTFWRSIGFDLELPNNNGKTMHGNCDLCFLKPAHQVFSLIAEKPQRAVWWAEQERKAGSVATGNADRFRDDRPSYAEMARYAASQRDAFGHEDEEAISCFCGD